MSPNSQPVDVRDAQPAFTDTSSVPLDLDTTELDDLLNGDLSSLPVTWAITATDTDVPTLTIAHSGTSVTLGLDRATTDELYDGLRTVKSWHRAALGDDHLPPESDPTARIKARFDPRQISDWWSDPDNRTQRSIYAAALIITVILALFGLLSHH